MSEEVDTTEVLLDGIGFLGIQITRLYDAVMLLAELQGSPKAHFQVKELRELHAKGGTLSPLPKFEESVFEDDE